MSVQPAILTALLLPVCFLGFSETQTETEPAAPYVIVLGNAQDGGTPQAGVPGHPGWKDPAARRFAACLGLVDESSGQRWMFEATPDFRDQLYRLDSVFPVKERPGLAGIFLTHAHIGHYTGLMFLGHESMGSAAVPVFVMPRLEGYLESNGPWSQLVKYGNIELTRLEAQKSVRLNERLSVTPFLVPHRQEFSEVIGFRIDGPSRSILFIPDIDSWAEMDATGAGIEGLIESVDIAYLDGTFFADGEIPGRDMSGFPHPFIEHSMERFRSLPPQEKKKIRFIHLNHTNPAQWDSTGARHEILRNGFRVAEEGERVGI